VLTAAVLLATKMTLVFTGVTLLVPSASNHNLVRVVTPNGLTTALSDIPPHVAYVMFDMANWNAANAASPGRRPDMVLVDPLDGRKFGVSLVNRELLEIGGSVDTSEKLCQPTKSEFEIDACTGAGAATTKPFPEVISPSLTPSQSSLHWLLDWGRGNPNIVSRLDPEVLRDTPASTHVSMRMNLANGKMRVLPTSFDLRFAYRYNTDGVCQALARAVTVEMQSSSTPATLTFKSTPFDGGSSRLPLKVSSAGDLAVLVGNEPVDHLEMSINILRGRKPSSRHEDTTGHMRLIEDLLTGGTLNRPAEIPAGVCQLGMSPQVSNNGSDGGTCNPNGMAAKDPAGH
jgi:hypothetical protein